MTLLARFLFRHEIQLSLRVHEDVIRPIEVEQPDVSASMPGRFGRINSGTFASSCVRGASPANS